MPLSTFSSYFLSVKSKYFISISSLTLPIICIASNELQSLIDALLYNTKQTMLVSTHPSYGTTDHSQPLTSQNFCLQTVLIYAVICQLRHQRSPASHSCKPSYHLKLGLPSGRLPLDSAWTAFLGIWLRGSLCTWPARCSLNQFMHVGTQIWEFFQLALSSHHIIEFPHHSTFRAYVTINSWTPGEACPFANILGVAHTSTCPMDFTLQLSNSYHSCLQCNSVLMYF